MQRPHCTPPTRVYPRTRSGTHALGAHLLPSCPELHAALSPGPVRSPEDGTAATTTTAPSTGRSPHDTRRPRARTRSLGSHGHRRRAGADQRGPASRVLTRTKEAPDTALSTVTVAVPTASLGLRCDGSAGAVSPQLRSGSRTRPARRRPCGHGRGTGRDAAPPRPPGRVRTRRWARSAAARRAAEARTPRAGRSGASPRGLDAGLGGRLGREPRASAGGEGQRPPARPGRPSPARLAVRARLRAPPPAVPQNHRAAAASREKFGALPPTLARDRKRPTAQSGCSSCPAPPSSNRRGRPRGGGPSELG